MKGNNPTEIPIPIKAIFKIRSNLSIPQRIGAGKMTQTANANPKSTPHAGTVPVHKIDAIASF